MTKFVEPVKGSRDFYPTQRALQNFLFEKAKKVSFKFGYQEFEGPLLEPMELYQAKSGSELVEKQAYVFADRGGRKVAIRPELTPTLARMIAVNYHQLSKPIRWFEIGQFWRYESPQKGRFREFYQWNVDICGSESVLADAEVIAMACNFFKSLNLTPSDIVVKISDRNLLNQKLATLKIKPNQKSAVINAIDKKDRIENLEYQKLLTAASLTNNQITKLEDFLNQNGSNSKSEWLITLFDCLKNYKVENYCQFDPKIVRGLDYYTSTVFEAFDRKNQFRAILAGGRYDNLISSVGGPDLPGVGFGLGDAVILLLLESLNKLPKLNPCPTQILVTLFDQNFLAKTLEIVTILRENEINCELYPDNVKLDKQLKYANSNNIPFVLIVGPDEFKQNLATIKNMQTGEQKTVRVEEIISQIKN